MKKLLYSHKIFFSLMLLTAKGVSFPPADIPIGPNTHYITENLKKIKFEEESEQKSWFSFFWWQSTQNANYTPGRIKSLRIVLNKLIPLFEPSRIPLIDPGPNEISKDSIKEDPLELLWYLYNLQYHNDTSWSFTLNHLNAKPKLLKICQRVKIKGFSPFSAVIIAPKASLEVKRSVIKKLYDLDFKPTKKDLEYAYLELYERDPKVTEKINLLLAGYFKNEESPLSLLPLDLIKVLTRYICEEKSLLE